MKVLFYFRGFESIGIEYLSAVLKAAGHQVELIFDPGFDDNNYMRLPFLKKLNRVDRMLRKTRAFQPDLLCFSCLTNLYPYVIRMAALLKQETGKPVLVGGPHPSALPEFVLGNPNVDMVCLGEGEEALVELANRMEAGQPTDDIRNIWFKRDGEIRRNPLRPLLACLDDLPLPDKDLFHRVGVFDRSVMVITSRGCSFNCNYCIHGFERRLYKGLGYKIRRRAVDNVLEELRLYKKKYNARMFLFEDDDFASDEAWLERFAEPYARQIRLPFYCLTNPRQITDRKLHLLKTAGCYELFMGIDSGSEEIRRNRLNRKFSDRELIETARKIKEKGIILRTTAMFAIPDETPEDMTKTVKMIADIKPDAISTYTFYPYPKTVLYDYAVEKGLIDEETRRNISEGKSSLHGMSVFAHPHKKLAYIYANTLPLFNRLPRALQPLFLRLAQMERLYWASPILYYLFVPITYPTVGILRIKDMIHLIVRSILPEKKTLEAAAQDDPDV